MKLPGLRWLTSNDEKGMPVWVFPAALLLFFLRFGYDYGTSDQDEIVPYLLHRLDPSLFTQDWFVMVQAGAFNVRSYFVTVVQSVAVFVPVWLAILLIYAVVWLALAAGVYALARRLTGTSLAASAAVVVALVLTPQWTLGGNDLASSMLVPSMAGWALGLWGVVAFLRARWTWAGVLLGLATWMQALVGLHLAGLLGLLLLERLTRTGARGLRPLLAFSAAFVLSALPALGPLVYQRLSATAPPEATAAPSLFYIMAKFRNPHHYLFYSFPTRSLIRFGGLVLGGGFSFAYLHRKGRFRHTGLILGLFGWITIWCFLAFFFSEVKPILFITTLQLFKTTVLAKLLLVIMICAAVTAALPEQLARMLRQLLHYRRWGCALTLSAWLVVAGGVWRNVDPLRARAKPLAHAETSLARVEAWAQQETSRTATFAVPPSWSGFRSRAHRAIVVDFKAFPFRDALTYTWFERLHDVAPIDLPERATPALQTQLDDAFLALSDLKLLDLARRYGVDYTIRRTSQTIHHPAFEWVFAAGEWTVYRIVVTDIAES